MITLGYFTLKALLLYPLHGRDARFVGILKPETLDLLGL